MRYYKIIDSTGHLLAIGIGDDGEEITEAEYNALMAEILKLINAEAGEMNGN